jgi:hypothetical protein
MFIDAEYVTSRRKPNTFPRMGNPISVAINPWGGGACNGIWYGNGAVDRCWSRLRTWICHKIYGKELKFQIGTTALRFSEFIICCLLFLPLRSERLGLAIFWRRD